MLIRMNSYTSLVEIHNGAATLEDSLPVSYEVKYVLNIQPSKPTPRYSLMTETLMLPQNLYMDIYTTVLLIISLNETSDWCSSTGE